MTPAALASLWPFWCDLLALVAACLGMAAHLDAWSDFRIIQAAGVNGLWRRATLIGIRRTAIRSAAKWLLFLACVRAGSMDIKVLLTVAMWLFIVVLVLERRERAYWWHMLSEDRGALAMPDSLLPGGTQ